jgi:hypothetical protein
MKKDSNDNVINMEPNEITLYNLYKRQKNDLGGRTRDDLPFTTEFDRLRTNYNAQVSQPLCDYDFWELLKSVLKYGEEKIERFLVQERTPEPPNSA